MDCGSAVHTTKMPLKRRKAAAKLEDPKFTVRYGYDNLGRLWGERIFSALNLLYLVPLSLMWLVGCFYALPGLLADWRLILGSIPLALLGLIPLLLCWACAESLLGYRLTFSQKGIDVKGRGPASAAMFNFRWHREWSDVYSVTLLDYENAAKKSKNKVRGKLALDYESGGSHYIELGSLPTEELDGLFQALERWCNKLVLSPEVLAIKDRVLLGEETRPEPVAISYTELWENSLHNRHASTAYMPLSSGGTLQDGRVQIISQVCSSGLSAVYLAERAFGGYVDRVIVKECFIAGDANEAKRAKAEELFKREAELLSKLDHSQIAKLIDVFEENGRRYIVMQHIPGTNLRQLVALKGPQPEPVVIEWAKQICMVLEYLHAQSPPVVHRDLTPDNVVLSEGSKISVVDFGAANEFLGKATGTLIGKQCYISPEQFRGKSEVRSDIYALGATMHFLLTGMDPEPLEPSSPRAVNEKISPELDELVKRCTESEADGRFATATELRAALEKLTQDRGETISIKKYMEV